MNSQKNIYTAIKKTDANFQGKFLFQIYKNGLNMFRAISAYKEQEAIDIFLKSYR